jgi:hypothetical protein
MQTEIALVIEGSKGTRAQKSLIYETNLIQPIPAMGDTFRIEADDNVFSGKVVNRRFDYTGVNEELGELALLVITIVGEEIP